MKHMKQWMILMVGAVLMTGTTVCAKVQQIPEIGLEYDDLDLEEEINLLIYPGMEDKVMCLEATYFNYSIMDPISDDVSELMEEEADEAEIELSIENYQEAAKLHSADYCKILGLETDNLEALCEKYEVTDENATKLGSNSTHTYYLIPIERSDTLVEEHYEEYEELRSVVDSIIDTVNIIEIEEREITEETFSYIKNFTTVDMEGNTVTEDIFKQADLTILNVWATTCSPCTHELPELEAMAEELPEGIQIIGLLSNVTSDADESYEKAKEILSDKGVAYTNLLASEDLQNFLGDIASIPTTFFIDSNGNSLYEPVIGAYVEKYQDIINEFLAK